LCDELVGPSGHDGLSRRVAGRVVVVAALGTASRVASEPHARIHGVHGRFAPGERMADEQVAHIPRVDTSTGQSRVEAPPSAPVGGLEAQVDGRRGGNVRAEDGVGEFEEGVGPAVEAFVERAAEGSESIGRIHDEHIMRSPRVLRILRHQRS
jgi:hypothetical protein